MDLQPRAPEHGTRRHHPNAKTRTRRLAPLLMSVKSGGITQLLGHLVKGSPGRACNLEYGAHLSIRSSRVRFAASLMQYRVPHRSAAAQPGLTQVLDPCWSLMARQSDTRWTTWAVIVGIVVCGGWYLTHQRPTNEGLAQAGSPPLTSPAPAAPVITIRAGTSVDAPIGGFSIKVDRVSGNSASLVVSSASNDTYRFKNAAAGQRLMIPSYNGMYFLDITEVHGNAISLTMGKQE